MPDELESSTVNGMTSDSTSSTADTAAGASTSVDTHTSSDPTPEGPSTATAPAPADTQNANDSSLINGAESKQQQQAQPNPWESRYKEAQSWATRTREENLSLQRRLQELESRFQQEQAKATPQVPMWDDTHANHAQFLDMVKTAQHYDRIINATQDETFKQSLIAMRDEQLGQDGLKTLREWRADVRQQEWERQINPNAYYRKLIQREAQPVIQNTLQSTSQNYQQARAAQEGVQKWLADNKDVATQDNLTKIQQMMQTPTQAHPRGMPFEVAAAMIERDHYRSQLSSRTAKDASVEEKQRLLEGNAAGTIARNPSSRAKVDLLKIRQEAPDSRKFIDSLFDLDQKGLL